MVKHIISELYCIEIVTHSPKFSETLCKVREWQMAMDILDIHIEEACGQS